HPTEVWVRINPGPLRSDDLRAVVGPALTGVCPAKTESVDDLHRVDEVLAGAEAGAGLARGTIRVAPLLESARAVMAAAAIAAGPRVVRIQAGEADLTSELGLDPGPDEVELSYLRSRMVMVSRAAGLHPPVGPIWAAYADLDGLRRSSEALRRMGYLGRACIHPAQVPIVHQVFTPDRAEVEAARALLDRFDQALAAGSGVITDGRGAMVDEAMVKAARRTLALGRRA
ncbi:MAG: HpcH/HpaI aldolase/citrate lyase family protein, partial [Acidimicrobiales bacterium]